MDRLASMFDSQMSTLGRWLIVIASAALIPTIFMPTWRITLRAPQYPNGLTMAIYPNTVEGDLREVNLLNHYIGMHSIEPSEFPEFRFIPFFILRFLGLSLLAAMTGRMAIAALGYLDFVVFGAVMLFTLQHWLSEFGQNLDPTAPLKLAPFAAKFLGQTRVGQFSVQSWPAAGAIMMTLAAILGPVVVGLEWRRSMQGDGRGRGRGRGRE
jgi:copper chaperone NosL